MGNNKASWFLAAALVSLIVAIVAGVIFSATGKTSLESLLYGGGVFGGCLVIFFAAFSLL